MDTLPAILIENEGWDTWDALVQKLVTYNVTVVLDDGELMCGAIHTVFQSASSGDYFIQLKEVDSEWELTGKYSMVALQLVTGIVVH